MNIKTRLWCYIAKDVVEMNIKVTHACPDCLAKKGRIDWCERMNNCAHRVKGNCMIGHNIEGVFP